MTVSSKDQASSCTKLSNVSKKHLEVTIGVHNTLPPTVAPIRATNSSTGMLKNELSASHVSAKALKGVVSIKVFTTRNVVVVDLNCAFPCCKQ